MEKLMPEEMLKNINANNKERGILKIFLGYAAGVGKTFHMLDLAQDEYKKGTNIVIGYIQKHARKKTLDMMKGIPIIENKVIKYKDILLEEFNLEKALEIKPELILIDELAHTNVEGSKHKKRYEDIEELLENGINVYTTLNIQHIEEIAKLVQENIEISIKETVPNEWVNKANQIELIDVPPEQLIKRIEDGKIYRKQNAKKAIENFFTIENLQLLRELALKYMVNMVDKNNISYTFKERILIVLNISKRSEEIIKEIDNEKTISNDNIYIIQLQSEEDNINGTNQINLIKEAGISYITIEQNSLINSIKSILEQVTINRIVFMREILKGKWLFPYSIIKRFPNQSILFR